MSSKSSNTGGQTGGCSTNTRGFAAETRQFATSGQGSLGDKAGRDALNASVHCNSRSDNCPNADRVNNMFRK